MKNLCFGVVTDIHYCDDEPYANRYLRMSLKKTEKVISHFNSENLEFVINMGDIIDKDFRSYKPVISIIDKCLHPVYHVPGNHDYEVEESKRAQIPELLAFPSKGYYDIDFNNWKFVMLNGNEISTYAYTPYHSHYKMAEEWLDKMGAQGRINGNDYNGGMSDEQLKWLQDKISEAGAENQQVILCCHFPVAPEDKHNLLNDREVIKILNQSPNVKAWLCGHNHSGNYDKLKFCHVVNFKGLVETKNEDAYAIVECSDSTIYIRGFGREPDRKLPLS